MSKSNFLNGYIEEINDEEISCLLRKDFNLDKTLIVKRSVLTKKQNEMLCIGLFLRYDTSNKKIEFMKSGKKGGWC